MRNLVGLALSSVVFLSAAPLLIVEAQAARATKELGQSLIPRGLPDGLRYPWTLTGTRALHEICYTNLRADIRPLVSRARNAANYASCEKLAQLSAQSWPTDAMSRITNAALALAREDVDDILYEIELSRQLAPNEGWLSSRRFVILASALAPTEDAIGSVFDRHLSSETQVMATTTFGVQLLADYYIQRPNLRPLIAREIDTLAEHDREHVLNHIRIRGLSE